MTAPEVTRVLAVCDGASIPATVDANAWETHIEVNAVGQKPTLNLRVESLAAKVIASLDGRAQDLVRIAAACYGVDQMVSRGYTDIHREEWRRELCLVMPVIDPALWSDPLVLTSLTEALGYGTEDTWEFVFTQRAEASAQMRLNLSDLPLVGSPDSVMLFSGGTDSLCVLVEAVAEQGRQPMVVSHRSAPQIDSVQRDLLKRLRTRFPVWSFPPMSFWIHKVNVHHSDSSQRTRGFLFAALGTAVAGQMGIDQVLLPDNGYVSINPPISGQLVGALASRGTHPAFLRLFNVLADRIFPGAVQVHNPLATRTRAEALAILAPHEVADLLDLTRSCGKHRSPKSTNEQPHCGGCSQCVDRRFATIAAGLADHDPAERYALDVFLNAIPLGEARTIALSYVDFARKTERANPEQLFGDIEELVACLDPEHPQFTAQANDVGSLLVRHGQEVVRVLADKVGAFRLPLARGDLSATSLLALLNASSSGDAGGMTAEPLAPGVDPPTVIDEDPTEEVWNGFRHHLGVWHIAFHGEKSTTPHRKGFTQIALLLQSPKQELDMVALKACEAVSVTRRSGPQGLRVGMGGSGGEVLSKDASANLNTRKRELPAEIQAARVRGRTALAEQLTVDLQNIKKLLRSSQGLSGRRRELDGPQETARKAVSKNIHECYELLDIDLSALRQHLEKWLDLGIPPVYAPDPPERWTISL